jgi:hypothetical protein
MARTTGAKLSHAEICTISFQQQFLVFARTLSHGPGLINVVLRTLSQVRQVCVASCLSYNIPNAFEVCEQAVLLTYMTVRGALVIGWIQIVIVWVVIA